MPFPQIKKERVLEKISRNPLKVTERCFPAVWKIILLMNAGVLFSFSLIANY
jgi:hypothetical protein